MHHDRGWAGESPGATAVLVNLIPANPNDAIVLL